MSWRRMLSLSFYKEMDNTMMYARAKLWHVG